MPDITDEEYAELQRLRSGSIAMELDLAKSRWINAHPHVPAGLVNAYQGDPTELDKFGQVLLESFPVPPAGAPAPVAPAQAPAPAPTTTTTATMAPAPSAPPQAQFQPQTSPAQVAQQYAQSGALGGHLVTPEQAAAQAPVSAPTPGSVDVLTNQDASVARSEQIREQMRIGAAKPADVQWLAQYGEHGFTNAMNGHARKIAAAVGRT